MVVVGYLGYGEGEGEGQGEGKGDGQRPSIEVQRPRSSVRPTSMTRLAAQVSIRRECEIECVT